MKTLVFFSAVLALALAPVSGQSMGTMKENARKELKAADVELNAVYQKALASRSEKGAAALKEAQRAWITYRDATAEAYGTGEEGGSLEVLMGSALL